MRRARFPLFELVHRRTNRTVSKNLLPYSIHQVPVELRQNPVPDRPQLDVIEKGGNEKCPALGMFVAPLISTDYYMRDIRLPR